MGLILVEIGKKREQLGVNWPVVVNGFRWNVGERSFDLQYNVV